MRIRLQDIADDLKLSKMTISRVLRGHADVNAQTKARVLQRMRELNYRPNASARGLRTGQSYRVGVLLPRIDDPWSAAVCQGLAAVFQAAGYAIAVSVTGNDPAMEEAQIDLHLSHHVDALMVAAGPAGPVSRDVPQDPGIPLFVLGRSGGDTAAYSVAFHEGEIGRMAATALLGGGARRIAYLRGLRTAANDERFAGFLKAHRDAGIAPAHELVREVRSAEGEYHLAMEAVTTLLHAPAPPDAVMANTDTLALGARDAALAAALRLPAQFQVVGCGNDPALCAVGLPLSSISFSAEELGARAARLALRAIANPDKAAGPQAARLSPIFVPRGTTRNEEAKPRRKEKPQE